jgi:hypothetical protein
VRRPHDTERSTESCDSIKSCKLKDVKHQKSEARRDFMQFAVSMQFDNHHEYVNLMEVGS